MFQHVQRAAEQAAISASRRAFLGKLGQGALTLAGVIGGILALPSEAQAGGPYCCCAGRCLRGKSCGRGCYRVKSCNDCL